MCKCGGRLIVSSENKPLIHQHSFESVELGFALAFILFGTRDLHAYACGLNVVILVVLIKPEAKDGYQYKNSDGDKGYAHK